MHASACPVALRGWDRGADDGFDKVVPTTEGGDVAGFLKAFDYALKIMRFADITGVAFGVDDMLLGEKLSEIGMVKAGFGGELVGGDIFHEFGVVGTHIIMSNISTQIFAAGIGFKDAAVAEKPSFHAHFLLEDFKLKRFGSDALGFQFTVYLLHDILARLFFGVDADEQIINLSVGSRVKTVYVGNGINNMTVNGWDATATEQIIAVAGNIRQVIDPRQ